MTWGITFLLKEILLNANLALETKSSSRFIKHFRFGTFDFLKDLVTGGQGVLSPGQRMVCGLGAGMTEAVLVVTWIETLKVRLIADQKKPKPRFRGLCHAAATIVREEVIL